MEKETSKSKKLSTLNKTLITALFGATLLATTPAQAYDGTWSAKKCEQTIKSQGFTDPEFIRHETKACVEASRTDAIIRDNFLTLRTYELFYHLENRHNVVFEEYNVLPNGNHRLNLFKYFPMKNGKGQPVKVFYIDTTKPGAKNFENTVQYLLDTFDKEKRNARQKNDIQR